MSFFDKAKAAASQAAAKAKQGAEDLQLKVDLGSAYDDLGKAAFELIEQGEVAHEKLDAPAAKVRELRQRMEGDATQEKPPTEDAPAVLAEEPAAANAPEVPAGSGEPEPQSGREAPEH